MLYVNNCFLYLVIFYNDLDEERDYELLARILI